MQTKPAACGKRLLALVLAIVMVCSLLPVSAFAAEPDYELRVLTFEDADYKGGTNFAGGNNWTSLIDSPQYGGKMLYGESGGGVDSVDAAYKWTDKNNTWLSNTLSEGYGSWCYWSGGHAVSNYVSGEISKYGGFESQLTVYKKDVSGLERTGGGLFEPNGETTRAMLVMVLYRMAGAPDMAGRESSFTDVSADSWYGAAVIWASENGIVNGVGGGLFDPDASLTREQMAMMLYRFAGYLGSNTEKRADLSAYGDADAVSAFAQDAMAWAVAEGLVNGRSAAELAPKAGATRAELATILFRFAALQNA